MSTRSLSPDRRRARLEVPRWLTAASIVGATLAGSAWLATRPSVRPLVPSAVLAAVVLCLRWPPVGLIALVVGGLTVPFAIGTGTETSINASVLLAGCLLGLWPLQMAARREMRLVGSPAIAAALSLGAVSLLAFLVGLQPWIPFAETAPLRAQVGGLAVFLLSIGVFLVAAHVVRDVRWLAALVWVFLALGAAYAIARALSSRVELPASILQQGADGSLFWTWLAALAFGQAALNRRIAAFWRLLLIAIVLIAFYATLGLNTGWTSGWLPALIAVAVALLVGAPRLAAPVIALAAAGGLLGWAGLHATVMGADNEYSLMTRLEAWQILERIVAINPVLGLGFANYHWYTPLFPILGYAVAFNSHNNYMDIVAQTGVVGLACFVWFAGAMAVRGLRLRSTVPAGFERAYVCGALGGLAGTLAAGMLGDWFLPFVYNVGLAGFRASVLAWLFLGGLVALEHAAARTASLPRRTGAQPGRNSPLENGRDNASVSHTDRREMEPLDRRVNSFGGAPGKPAVG